MWIFLCRKRSYNYIEHNRHYVSVVIIKFLYKFFTAFPRIECARCIYFSALTVRILFEGALNSRAPCKFLLV